MQTGEYIRNRLLPEAIKAACDKNGVSFESFSDDWVLKLTKQAHTYWISGYKFDSNSAAASHLAQDKVATYQVLSRAGTPAVEHMLARSLPSEPIAQQQLGKHFANVSVVVKPLSGTGGRGVQRFAHIEQACAHIQDQSEPAWAVSPYLELVAERRFIVYKGTILMAYDKQHASVEHGLKFFNLSHGAQAVDLDIQQISTELTAMALSACYNTGLTLAAVDIVELVDGSYQVLEINDGFSMEHYARESAEHDRRAYELYESIVKQIFDT